MKKKYAKIKLIIIAVLVVIGLCLSIFAFDIPGTSDTFLGFIGAIDTSTELGESYKVVYTVDREDGEITNAQINEGVEELYDIFTKFISNFNDVRITRATKNDEEQIVCYVPNNTLGSQFFDLFAESQKFEVKNSDGEVIVTNKNIKAATYTSDGTNYGVYMELDTDGTRELIKYQNETPLLTFTIDDATATGQIINNALFITNDTLGASASESSSAAIKMLAGKLPFTMSLELNTTIDALNGENVKTILKIATGIVAGLYVVYMILAHKLLGLTSLLSGGIYVVINSFVLQSIPVTSMTLASYFGVLVAFVIYAISIEYQINKMKEEYQKGKRLPHSIKQGYKSSILTLMDIHIVTFILALAIVVLGTKTLQAVAINLICGIVVSALLTMLVNRYFIKLLVDIYPQKPLLLNFKKGVNKDEI